LSVNSSPAFPPEPYWSSLEPIMFSDSSRFSVELPVSSGPGGFPPDPSWLII